MTDAPRVEPREQQVAVQWEDEWHEALARLEQAAQAADAQGAATTRELADAWGCSVPTARKLLRLLVRADRVEVVRARRAGMDGISRIVTAYRMRRPAGE